MFSLLQYSSILLYLFPLTICQDTYGYYHELPEGEQYNATDPVYQIRSIQIINWTTTLSEYTVWLGQRQAAINDTWWSTIPLYNKTDEEEEIGWFAWLVTTNGLSLAQGNQFVLGLNQTNESHVGFISSSFNITAESSQPNTSIPMPSEPTFSEPVGGSWSDPSPASSKVVTLAVGLGFGVPFLIGMIAFYRWRCWKSRSEDVHATSLSGGHRDMELEDIAVGAVMYQSEMATRSKGGASGKPYSHIVGSGADGQLMPEGKGSLYPYRC